MRANLMQQSLREINLETFCRQVSEQPAPKKLGVFPEQVLEVVGGLANLYLETLIKLGRPQLQTKTKRAFASDFVPEATVLREIANCSGLNDTASSLILLGMEEVLRKHFLQLEIHDRGRVVRFKPLGELEVLNLDGSSYLLTYRDPAAGLYETFLLP